MIDINILRGKLYHGSLFNIEDIDLTRCSSGTDFGKGFYMTSSIEQAERFVKSLISKHNGVIKSGYVNIYEYEEIFYSPKVQLWETPCKEWLHCIASNRRPKLYNEKIKTSIDAYDIIIGPVADDKVGKTVSAYLEGVYGDIADEATINFTITRCKAEIYANQLCFRTQRAVDGLQKVGVVENVH